MSYSFFNKQLIRDVDTEVVLFMKNNTFIGLYIAVPTGGEISFFGSRDAKLHWTPMTFKDSSSIESTQINTSGNYTAITDYVYIKFYTSQGGSAHGSISGSMRSNTSDNANITNLVDVSANITNLVDVTANAGTNLNTSLLALESGNIATVASDTTSIDAKTPALGQAVMTASVPVVISSDHNALVVDGSASTQPVSGPVTANAGTNLNTSLLALESGNVLKLYQHPNLTTRVQLGEAPAGYVNGCLNCYSSVSSATFRPMVKDIDFGAHNYNLSLQLKTFYLKSTSIDDRFEDASGNPGTGVREIFIEGVQSGGILTETLQLIGTNEVSFANTYNIINSVKYSNWGANVTNQGDLTIYTDQGLANEIHGFSPAGDNRFYFSAFMGAVTSKVTLKKILCGFDNTLHSYEIAIYESRHILFYGETLIPLGNFIFSQGGGNTYYLEDCDSITFTNSNSILVQAKRLVGTGDANVTVQVVYSIYPSSLP